MLRTLPAQQQRLQAAALSGRSCQSTPRVACLGARTSHRVKARAAPQLKVGKVGEGVPSGGLL